MEPSAPASDESSTFGAIHDWAMENEQAQQQEGEDTNKLYQQVHPQAQPQPKSDDRIIIEHIDQITTQPSPTFVKRPHPQKSAIISSIFTFKDTLYSVSLTHDGILWTRQTSSGPRRLVKYECMVNAKCSDTNSSNTLFVYYCTWPKDPADEPELRVASFTSLLGHEEADSWAKIIVSQIFNVQEGVIPPRRSMTVLVNPFGGTKTAKKIWKNIQDVFEVADIDVNMIETKHAGHAEEYALNTDLAEFKDGIVTISGDGLLCEVINGLLKRKDWEQAIKPGGSGNGLAASISATTPMRAAFFIARGKTSALDVMSVLYGTNKKRFGILSVEWGSHTCIFSDDSVAVSGSARFAIWALKKVIDWDVHKGMLFYYPEEVPPKLHKPPEEPIENVDDNSNSNESNTSEPEVKIDETKPTEDAQTPAPLVVEAVTPPCYPDHGPPMKYLPLDDLTHWRGSAGSFIFFLASNVTHIALDTHAAPKAHMSDGCIDLIIIRKSTRVQMAKVLTALETGEHVDHPDVEYIKCRSFVLRPEAYKGDILLGVDGEKIEPTTNLQVEVHQGLMQIFCK